MSKKNKKTTPPAEAAPGDAETPSVETSGTTGSEASASPTGEPPPQAAEDGQPTELERTKDRLLRLQADFDNFRKRMARERQETVLRANEELLDALLTPLDHLDRAIEAIQQDRPGEDPFLQGVRMVRDELQAVLERFGLKPIEALGEAFDPNRHDALGLMPAGAGEGEPGQVAAEVRRGYLLNGRVLRAAQVLVLADDQGPGGSPGEPAAVDPVADAADNAGDAPADGVEDPDADETETA